MQLSHTTQLQSKNTLKLFTFEIIDAVHKAVKERFEQPIFVIFSIVDNYY